MRELNTIQKREKLNTIYATDEKGNDGAHHEYHIVVEAEEDAAYDVRIIKFQEGPRKDINSTQGIIDSDLLETVRDRLKDFQAGPLVVGTEEAAPYDVRIIKFQEGPRKDINSTQGIIDSDLLEIVRDRLKDFQAGPFACKENEHALTHIEEALMWMNRRVEDRIERNVLGKNEK